MTYFFPNILLCLITGLSFTKQIFLWIAKSWFLGCVKPKLPTFFRKELNGELNPFRRRMSFSGLGDKEILTSWLSREDNFSLLNQLSRIFKTRKNKLQK
jgi:hypothetical protein